MTDTTAPASASPPERSAVGKLLQRWRATRRLSQLDLSLDAGISTRHLSYVETGRSRPSRDLIELLADALAVPLRERNTLLVAAGFAPRYLERSLNDPELAKVKQAIELILERHDPDPAFVLDRYWDLLMANRGLARVLGMVRGGKPKHSNILRQVFDPDDMRPYIANWHEVAGDLVRHLHQQTASAPHDKALRALLDEVLAYPEVPLNWRYRELGAVPQPVITTIFRLGDDLLSFFSTLTTFGAPLDITLDEIRIECMFPADERTSEICRALANES